MLRLGLFILLLTFSDAASAQELNKQTCVDLHVKAQRQRLAGELIASKKSLKSCANRSCPLIVQQDCFNWLDDLSGQIPTLIFEAWDDEGELSDVTVFKEGELLSHVMNGRAIEVDPGYSTFDFSTKDGRRMQLNVLVREGDENRLITADFTRPASWLTLRVPPEAAVSGSLSLVATSVAVGFGVSALIRQQQALGSCAPNCPESTVNSIATSALIADISGAVAIVTAMVTLAYIVNASVKKPLPVASGLAPIVGTSPRSAVFGLRGDF